MKFPVELHLCIAVLRSGKKIATKGSQEELDAFVAEWTRVQAPRLRSFAELIAFDSSGKRSELAKGAA